jgi:large subunit ribosomal protein L18
LQQGNVGDNQMARSRRQKIAFRRRREGKTNYTLRRRLVLSGKTRVVIRLSNTQTSVQLVKSYPEGDKTMCQATSKNLVDLGWKAATGNIPSAYLTGYYFGKKALLSKVIDKEEPLILDIGLTRKFYGGKLFATLKGVVDAGLNVIHGDEKIFPPESRLRGEHIAEYEKVLKEKEVKDHRFSKLGIKPSGIPKHFDAIKSKIEKTSILK